MARWRAPLTRANAAPRAPVAVAVTSGHATTVTHECPPPAWDTKHEAHQRDVLTSRTDTRNVFLCLFLMARGMVARYVNWRAAVGLGACPRARADRAVSQPKLVMMLR